MSKRRLSRSKEREELFKLLFQSFMNTRFEIKNIDSEYITKQFEGITKNWQNYEEIIKNKIKRWKYAEIGIVEKVLIHLALYEIIHSKIDHKIAINEVIEIAKKYGDENTPSFINGVLGEVVNNVN